MEVSAARLSIQGLMGACSEVILISIIESVIELLVSAGETNWAAAFIDFRKQCDNPDVDNLERLRGEILRIYGGMGSFNDLVLYEQGQPMIKENQKLDKLRKELFYLKRQVMQYSKTPFGPDLLISLFQRKTRCSIGYHTGIVGRWIVA